MDARGLNVRKCEVHARHTPRIDRAGGKYTIHLHHVWPQQYGGPDEAWNIVSVCPTGHDATHELLRAWIKASGEPTWEIRQKYHPRERALAKAGYLMMTGRVRVEY